MLPTKKTKHKQAREQYKYGSKYKKVQVWKQEVTNQSEIWTVLVTKKSKKAREQTRQLQKCGQLRKQETRKQCIRMVAMRKLKRWKTIQKKAGKQKA